MNKFICTFCERNLRQDGGFHIQVNQTKNPDDWNDGEVDMDFVACHRCYDTIRSKTNDMVFRKRLYIKERR